MTRSLADFRVDAAPTEDTSPQPFAWQHSDPLRVLAFDQTLSKTGWAVFRLGRPVLSGMNVVDDRVASSIEMLDRAAELFLGWVAFLRWHGPDLVAHEAPPTRTGRMAGQGKSSLAAAVALRCAAESLKIPCVAVYAQTVKVRMTGNHKASKAEVSAAVKVLVPGAVDLKPLNQDVCDAIGVGVVAIEKGRASGQ